MDSTFLDYDFVSISVGDTNFTQHWNVRYLDNGLWTSFVRHTSSSKSITVTLPMASFLSYDGIEIQIV